MNQHDASYKQLFSNPLIVRSLFEWAFQAASPDLTLPGVDDLIWEKAKPWPTEFVSKQLRKRGSDCIWCIPRKNGPDLHLLLLLEFQSGNDVHMALRVTTYVLLLYDLLIKQEKIKAGQAYPTVLPVVLYNGVAPWTAGTRLADMLSPTMPWPSLAPAGGYILVDEGELLRQGLVPQEGLMSLLIRLEHCTDIEQFGELVQTVVKQTSGPYYEQARHAFFEWIKHELWPRNAPNHLVKNVHNFKELTVMLTQERVTWTDRILIQGREEGLEQGIQQGASELLERQLVRKFGPLSRDIQQRIKAATAPELEVWSLNFVDAATLDDVFSE